MVQILSWTVRLYKHLYRNVNLGSSIVPYWTTKEVWRGKEGEMKLARKLVPDVRDPEHGSVGRGLTLHLQGPGFSPWHPRKQV